MIVLAQVRVGGFKVLRTDRTISFSTGLTAVQGPNGSGKSCLIDALNFGMGCTSLPTLRVASWRELVSDDAGTSEAAVELTFRGVGVGGAEETVGARLAKRDEKRAYSVNGKVCSWKEHQVALSRLGLAVESCSCALLQNRTAALIVDGRLLLAILQRASGTEGYRISAEHAKANVTAAERKRTQFKRQLDEIEQAIAKDVGHLRELEARKHLAISVYGCGQKLLAMQEDRCDALQTKRTKLELEASLAQERQSARTSKASANNERQASVAQSIADAKARRAALADQLKSARELVSVSREEELLLKAEDDEASAERAELQGAVRKTEEQIGQKHTDRSRQLAAQTANAASAEEVARAVREAGSARSAAHLSSVEQQESALGGQIASGRQEQGQLAAELKELEATANAIRPKAAQPDGGAQGCAQGVSRHQVQQQEAQLVETISDCRSNAEAVSKASQRIGRGAPNGGTEFIATMSFESVAEYAAALSAIAGPKLQFVACDSVKQATEILCAHKSTGASRRELVLWPLDRAARKCAQRQRQLESRVSNIDGAVAASSLVRVLSGQPSLPRDLCFDGFAIAKTRRASQILAHNGIPHSDLDGTLTWRGRMQGGYRSGTNSDVITTTIRLKTLRAEGKKLGQLRKQLENSVKRGKIELRQSAEREQAQSKLHEQESAIAAKKEQHSRASQHVAGLQYALSNSQKLMAALKSTGNQESLQARQKALAREQSCLRDDVEAITTEISILEASMQTATADSAQLETAELARRKGLDALRERVQAQDAGVTKLEAAESSCAKTIASLEDSALQQEEMLSQAVAKSQADKTQARQAKKSIRDISKQLSSAEREIAVLRAEKLELESKFGSALESGAKSTKSAQSDDDDADEMEQYDADEAVVRSTWKELKVELASTPDCIPDAHQTLKLISLSTKRSQLEQIKSRKVVIENGLAALSAGLDASREKVRDADEGAVEHISATFSAMFSKLCPSKATQLKAPRHGDGALSKVKAYCIGVCALHSLCASLTLSPDRARGARSDARGVARRHNALRRAADAAGDRVRAGNVHVPPRAVHPSRRDRRRAGRDQPGKARHTGDAAAAGELVAGHRGLAPAGLPQRREQETARHQDCRRRHLRGLVSCTLTMFQSVAPRRSKKS